MHVAKCRNHKAVAPRHDSVGQNIMTKNLLAEALGTFIFCVFWVRTGGFQVSSVAAAYALGHVSGGI